MFNRYVALQFIWGSGLGFYLAMNDWGINTFHFWFVVVMIICNDCLIRLECYENFRNK